MSTIPCTCFAATRVHESLNHQQHRPKFPSAHHDLDNASLHLGSGNAAPNYGAPELGTFFLKDGQVYSRSVRKNPDGSTSVVTSPVTNPHQSMCSPGLLIHSDNHDPATITEANLKPVPSQSSAGPGPRRG